MKKTIIRTGLNGTVTGTIEVLLNHSRQSQKGTHAITHDDFVREIKVHHIIGKIGDELVLSKRVNEHEDLAFAVANAEREMEAKITGRASHVPKLSNIELLNKLGYKQL